jgi:hypothetical protein
MFGDFYGFPFQQASWAQREATKLWQYHQRLFEQSV